MTGAVRFMLGCSRGECNAGGQDPSKGRSWNIKGVHKTFSPTCNAEKAMNQTISQAISQVTRQMMSTSVMSRTTRQMMRKPASECGTLYIRRCNVRREDLALETRYCQWSGSLDSSTGRAEDGLSHEKG